MDLGLSAEALFRCRSDHSLSTHGAVLAGLVQWRRSEGKKATVQRLMQSLQAAGIHPSVLDDVLTWRADLSSNVQNQQMINTYPKQQSINPESHTETLVQDQLHSETTPRQWQLDETLLNLYLSDAFKFRFKRKKCKSKSKKMRLELVWVLETKIFLE